MLKKQGGDELGILCPSYLPEVVQEWVEEAKKEARLFQRASGAFSSQLAWQKISPLVKVEEPTPAKTTEWEPPPGERNRKLLDEGFISLAREAAGAMGGEA